MSFHWSSMPSLIPNYFIESTTTIYENGRQKVMYVVGNAVILGIKET